MLIQRKKKSALSTSIEIIKCIPQRMRQEFIVQTLLTTFSSIAEVATLALVSTSLTTISGSGLRDSLSLLGKINDRLDHLSIGLTPESVFSISILAIIISCILRIITVYRERDLVVNIGSQLSNNAYRNILDQDFSYFINSASSYLIANMTTYSGDAALYSYWTMQMLSSFILSIILITTSLTVNPVVTVTLSIGCAAYYALYAKKTKTSANEASKSVFVYNQAIISEIQEATSSIADLKLGGLECYYINRYKRVYIISRDYLHSLFVCASNY